MGSDADWDTTDAGRFHNVAIKQDRTSGRGGITDMVNWEMGPWPSTLTCPGRFPDRNLRN